MACGVEWRARVQTALKAEHREGEAGRGCYAACVVGAWRPRDERALTRSGAVRRKGAARCGGWPVEQASAGAGQACEVGWAAAKALLGQTRGGRAGGGRGGRPSRLRPWAEKGGGGP